MIATVEITNDQSDEYEFLRDHMIAMLEVAHATQGLASAPDYFCAMERKFAELCKLVDPIIRGEESETIKEAA